MQQGEPHNFRARVHLYVLLFALTAAVTASCSLISAQASRLARLRDVGTWTQGGIDDSRCQKSLHFDYTFVVSGSHYRGMGTGPSDCCVDFSRNVCEQFTAGRSIKIVYSPGDPSSNFYGDPGAAYEGALMGSGIGSLCFASMACIVMFMFARNSHSAVGRWVRSAGF